MAHAQSDAGHNLLFGLLALQNGMINQAALLVAFHAWTEAKERSMGEILAEQGAITGPRRALLDALVAEHLLRLRRDVAAGYRSIDAFTNESGLNPIRSRPDFQLLMMDLAMPAKAFTD